MRTLAGSILSCWPLGSLRSSDCSHCLAIIAGLFLGKQLGVFGACAAATKLGIAAMPVGVRTLQFYGVAILTGIGFTMSLFIGSLAYEDTAVLDQIRIGVLVASVQSGALGALGALVLTAAGRAAFTISGHN